MDTEQNDRPKIPKVQFRVLILGRSKAGKTSVLQGVCDTTDGPDIYSFDEKGICRVELSTASECCGHDIDNELIFSRHDGYIFHDSCGFQAGGEEEKKIVQDFLSRRLRERKLKDRLHVIWYCFPMDTDRPTLDSKLFENICQDKNIPVIAVFTKYDQFRMDTEMQSEDQGLSEADLDAEVEKCFTEHYLSNIRRSLPYVRLEKMHKPDKRLGCNDLIQETANALSDCVVTLMLLAVQKDNLELNIRQAVKWVHSAFERGNGSIERVIKLCILAFPSIWDSVSPPLLIRATMY